jgi:hypothetical protein
VGGLTIAVFLVFVVKPISAFQSDVVDLPDQTTDSIGLSDFFLLLLCEILPTATILTVFRAVPSSRVTRCSVCCGTNQSLEELEESLTRRQGQQWSASNSNEYWDQRRKSDVLGSRRGFIDNGNGVVRGGGGSGGTGGGSGESSGGRMHGVVADNERVRESSSNNNSNLEEGRLPPMSAVDEARSTESFYAR